jgi:serine/threonine protein kinase
MEAIGRLDHANIVRAFDAGDIGGTHYLAMELVDGRDVDKLLKLVGRFDTGSACEIARQAALGLQHVADNRLVHRDIKPSNLLINHDGTVKVLDLGIARLRRDEETHSSQTSMGSMMGTPDYVAPEQIESSAEVDIRADIYSLGCTLYTLIAGRPPFFGKEYGTQMSKLLAHAKQDPPRLDTVAPETPIELSNLVHRMMAKNRSERVQTPQNVADLLLEWSDAAALKSLPLSAKDGQTAVHGYQVARDCGQLRKPTPKTSGSSKKHVVTVAVIGAVVAGIMVLGPFAQHAGDETSHLNTSEGDIATTLPTSVTSRPAGQNHAGEPLHEIATSTSSIAADSHKVAASTERIDRNTERIADTLDGLRDAFRMAARSGDIVSEPNSIGELYHNARAYQRQGNFEAARQTYLAMFEQNGDFVDVHQEFQLLLESRYDSGTIRDIYMTMPGDANGIVRRFAIGMLEEDAARREILLREIVSVGVDFAPAVFELSRLSSLDYLGAQGLADKRREHDWLAKFRDLATNEGLTRFYLDSTRAEESIADAEKRWVAVQSISESLFESPVTVNFMSSRGFASVTVSVGEPTLEIRYRLKETDEFQTTGHAAALSQSTGQPVPNTLIMLPAGSEPQGIDIEYVDIRKNSQGPFYLELGKKALEQDSRNKLDLMAAFLVKFVDRRGSQFLDLQNIATCRNVITEVRYGLNVDEPTETKVLSDPMSDGARNRVDIGDDVEFAVIQLLYTDGTTSPVRRYDRTAHQR